MGLEAVNTKFCSLIFYFILFKERLLGKHSCIVVFVKLMMFPQDNNKEQDVPIIDSSIAKDIFSSVLKLLISWLVGAFCIYLFQCSKYEYLSYPMNFLFNISFLFSQ